MSLAALIISLVHLVAHIAEKLLAKRSPKAVSLIEEVDDVLSSMPLPVPPPPLPKPAKLPAFPAALMALAMVIGAGSGCTAAELAIARADTKVAVDIGGDICAEAPELMANEPAQLKEACAVIEDAKDVADVVLVRKSKAAGAGGATSSSSHASSSVSASSSTAGAGK